MLFCGVLFMLVAVSADTQCQNYVESICKNTPIDLISDNKCSAMYGQFDNEVTDLQKYVQTNLQYSFQYLLMSSYFGSFEAQREGFKALYRKLSDQSWEDAISVLKYIGKRGGDVNFSVEALHINTSTSTKSNLEEIHSLGKALDMQRVLVNGSSHIHSMALVTGQQDAGIIHYMQEQFIEPQTDRIRDLAGYITDLKEILATEAPGIGVFLFDEYLKKSL